MITEHKELLLKDLSARTPYGVKVSVNQSQLQNYHYKWKNWNFDEEPPRNRWCEYLWSYIRMHGYE